MIHPSDINIYQPYLELVNLAIDYTKASAYRAKVVLLDAGCGHSTVLENEYKRCQQIIGVDLDRAGLAQNKLLDQKIYADLCQIPVADSSVDIITSAWVLEHIKQPKRFAKEVNRLLKPGGFFVFLAPNKWGIYTCFSRLIPTQFHSFITEKIFNRGQGDTFPAYYFLNSEADLDHSFSKNFVKLKFIYNDDPKYYTFGKDFKPLGKIMYQLLMTRWLTKLRGNIIGIYQKK